MSEFTEYQNYKEYQENEKYQYNNNNNNLKSLVTESQIMSELNNYTNPSLTSSEIQFDENKMIVKPAKYAEPRYIKEKEVYEVLKPVTKQIVQLPTKKKQKVKTTKAVIKEAIVISEDDDLNKILQDNKIFGSEIDAPLPTQSIIQNLCKESIISSSNNQSYNYQSELDNNLLDKNNYQSKIIDTNYYDNQSKNQNQYSSKIKTSNNNNTTNIKYSNTNNNNNYQLSNSSNYPNTNININNEQNISNSYVNKNINKNANQLRIPNINKDYHQSKIQMSKIPYMNISKEGGFAQKKIVQKYPLYNNNNATTFSSNKNYIETYFHDDDIPLPTVYEGDALKNTDIKPSLKNDNEKDIKYSLNEKNNEENVKNSYKNSNNIENNSVNKTINKNINESYNINKNSIEKMNKSTKINNINDTDDDINNNIDINNNNINNININNINDINEISKIQVKSISNELPDNKTEKMSHQQSKDISQMKDSSILKKSSNQSAMEGQNLNINLNLQKKLSPSSQIQQSNINQNLVQNSKIQKSYMTYQQSYIPGNQTKTPVYHSQVYNNKLPNFDKPISESININNSSSHETNNKQLYINGKPIAQVSKIENQSDIYQKSLNNSHINKSNINNSKINNSNINNSNINNSNINNSNINNSNKNDSRINSSNINNFNNNISSIHQSNELIYSNNKSKNKKSNIQYISQNDINRSKNNNNNNSVFRDERSSFPTKSFAGKINSKETLPPNPFEDENQNDLFKKSSSMINNNVHK